MTLILIFLGWFILSSLWGFLPLIEPLRLFAISSLPRRRASALAAALPAFLTGTLLLLWISSYSTVMIMVYDAHASSAAQDGSMAGQAPVNPFSAATQLALRQLLPGAGCLSRDAAVCAMAASAYQLGPLTGMLPVMSLAALIPALAAAFICWKLTAIPQAPAPA